jgi:hypothetical protein
MENKDMSSESEFNNQVNNALRLLGFATDEAIEWKVTCDPNGPLLKDGGPRYMQAKWKIISDPNLLADVVREFSKYMDESRAILANFTVEKRGDYSYKLIIRPVAEQEQLLQRALELLEPVSGNRHEQGKRPEFQGKFGRQEDGTIILKNVWLQSHVKLYEAAITQQRAIEWQAAQIARHAGTASTSISIQEEILSDPACIATAVKGYGEYIDKVSAVLANFTIETSDTRLGWSSYVLTVKSEMAQNKEDLVRQAVELLNMDEAGRTELGRCLADAGRPRQEEGRILVSVPCESDLAKPFDDASVPQKIPLSPGIRDKLKSDEPRGPLSKILRQRTPGGSKP